MPLPSEDTTPPVTNTNLVIAFGAMQHEREIRIIHQAHAAKKLTMKRNLCRRPANDHLAIFYLQDLSTRYMAGVDAFINQKGCKRKFISQYEIFKTKKIPRLWRGIQLIFSLCSACAQFMSGKQIHHDSKYQVLHVLLLPEHAIQSEYRLA